MPTSFHEREQAFEAKFAHDEEFRFLVRARGDRLFAVWAANRLLLTADPAAALTNAVLAVPDGPEHDRALVRYVADFLAERGVGVPEQDLGATLAQCRQEALRQLTEAPPDRSDVV